MGTGTRFVDEWKPEHLYEGSASGGTTSLWLDMSYYSHITFFVTAVNGGSPTGAAITVNQATSNTGTGSKALAYNNYFSATGGFGSQASAADAMTQTTGVSGTFTTGTTASTALLYAIEVQDTDLDLTNLFNYVQLAIGSGSSGVTFYAWAACYPRFSGKFDTMVSALV